MSKVTVQSGSASLRFGLMIDEDDESDDAIMEDGGWFAHLLEEDGPGLEDMLRDTVLRFIEASGLDHEDPALHISVDVYS